MCPKSPKNVSHHIRYLEKTLKICEFFLKICNSDFAKKWADKEGSSALAVWKGFVLVLMFECSVAATTSHHLSCKSHIKKKCLNIF